MSSPDDPDPASAPLRDFLLAQALDACLRAERRTRGSSAPIIAEAPVDARAELTQLVELARQLESARPAAAPSPAFRSGARARLLAAIGGVPDERPAPRSSASRAERQAGPRISWLVRSIAAVLAGLFATAATVTASASALPGDPLYAVKQAQEELAVRLAVDDEAQVQALLWRADARLDEATRLLDQGRTAEAVAAAERYDQVVGRAASTFATSTETDDLYPEYQARLVERLLHHQLRLEALVRSAPERARSDLLESVAAAERSLGLTVDTRPADPPAAQQPEPTTASPQPDRPVSHGSAAPANLPPSPDRDATNDRDSAVGRGSAAGAPDTDRTPDPSPARPGSQEEAPRTAQNDGRSAPWSQRAVRTDAPANRLAPLSATKPPEVPVATDRPTAVRSAEVPRPSGQTAQRAWPAAPIPTSVQPRETGDLDEPDEARSPESVTRQASARIQRGATPPAAGQNAPAQPTSVSASAAGTPNVRNAAASTASAGPTLAASGNPGWARANRPADQIERASTAAAPTPTPTPGGASASRDQADQARQTEGARQSPTAAVNATPGLAPTSAASAARRENSVTPPAVTEPTRRPGSGATTTPTAQPTHRAATATPSGADAARRDRVPTADAPQPTPTRESPNSSIPPTRASIPTSTRPADSGSAPGAGSSTGGARTYDSRLTPSGQATDDGGRR